jgi:osmoprotectant transport system ATP-binding protein
MTRDDRGHIEFIRVAFGYPGRTRTLDDVDLEIPTGSILALVGRSGAGKSTILKLINGLLQPSTGSVSVGGRQTKDWDGIRLRRHIGYVLQDVGLFPHMTIAENVGLVPRLEGWAPDRTEARVRELLTLVGLPYEQYASRSPRELSGGQRQRVGVARALAVGPPILLMDEPFGALDPVTRKELHREFARIHANIRPTVVIVTHDMAEAFAMATHVGVLSDGALVAMGTPADVRASRDPRVQVFL